MIGRSSIIRKILILEDEESGIYSIYPINDYKHVTDVQSYRSIDECWKRVKSIANIYKLKMEDIDFISLEEIINHHATFKF